MRIPRLPALLAAATIALGAGAAWAHAETGSLRGTPAARNAALADGARTAEVKGQITEAANTLFSYNAAAPAKTDQAAKSLLVGQAVKQYDAMLAAVRRDAPAQKLVLTTTVTDAAVRTLQNDRARLLLFLDQRSASGATGKSTDVGAMLAVDAVRRNGHWQIAALDPLGGS
ncbi:hypothetical protein [Actinomadura gamaensis]|uniref:Mce-associated membrane protein n=1 Tax=Actinomadura gamaensis TaxID=1763541 RepID=A0ABV9U1G0_9ACTN